MSGSGLFPPQASPLSRTALSALHRSFTLTEAASALSGTSMTMPESSQSLINSEERCSSNSRMTAAGEVLALFRCTQLSIILVATGGYPCRISMIDIVNLLIQSSPSAPRSMLASIGTTTNHLRISPSQVSIAVSSESLLRIWTKALL